MILTLSERLAWIVYLFVHPLLVTYLVQKKAANRFPITFCLLCFDAIVSPSLYLLSSHYYYYFYVYWVTYPVRSLLRLGVFIDVVRAIPNFKIARNETISSFTIVASLLICGCVYLAMENASRAWQPHFAGVALGIDQGVSLLWLFLPLTAYFILGTHRVIWSERARRVGIANILLSLMAVANGYALRLWPDHYVFIDALQNPPVCILWIYIAYAIAGPEPGPRVVNQELRQEQERLLGEYLL